MYNPFPMEVAKNRIKDKEGKNNLNKDQYSFCPWKLNVITKVLPSKLQ
jgi:hypothetical protein